MSWEGLCVSDSDGELVLRITLSLSLSLSLPEAPNKAPHTLTRMSKMATIDGGKG